ncbi:PhzF family phenazine biosynthesis protein [Actinoplanes sp. CA-030573]|uniref:PhzF family phenazine biosynthesis protein n=1 Tax=Actinoplanes sp. CA-030573 TaxID=3239898 RepID=UPI003D8DA1C7
MTVAFALVDVFADRPLAGNPLAVVPDADRIDEAVLPRIAAEFNQSETTFVVAPTVAGADFRLRSFTPAGVEVYGAGHNALGVGVAALGADKRLPVAQVVETGAAA